MRKRLLVFNLATDADDPILGFTSTWLRALASLVDEIDVVTMRAGRLNLPNNVSVYSVGKERGFVEARRVLEFYRVLTHLLVSRPYGACFAHMMPLFAAMGAPLLKVQRVPVTLWYAHAATTRVLRLAAGLSDRIVTASPGSFRLPSRRVVVTGQGIDTDRFSPAPAEQGHPRCFCIVTVGRVAPVKRLELVIDAVAELNACNARLQPIVRIVGPIAPGDQQYARELVRRGRTAGLGKALVLTGPMGQASVIDEFQRADVAVNMTGPGSFDKAALEAMSCGLPVVTVNPDLACLLQRVDPGLAALDAPGSIAAALARLAEMPVVARHELGLRLRHLVLEHHSLERLAGLLVNEVLFS